MSVNTVTIDRTPTSQSIAERTFVADRVLSGGSALALIAGSSAIASVLDWATPVVLAVGLGLVLNTLLLHTIIRRRAFSSLLAKVSADFDIAWVLVSLAIAAGLLGETSTIGRWLIAAGAAGVGAVAILKVVGIGYLQHNGDARGDLGHRVNPEKAKN